MEIKYFQKVFTGGSLSFFAADEQRAKEESEKYNKYLKEGILPGYMLQEITKEDYDELVETYHNVHKFR